MDTGIFTANDRPMIIQQLLPALGPVLLIAIGYVDPGKWAAVVEGGARFGSDLVLLMLVFSFGAILCQYLSASIAVVTGRDLSQICSEEYGKATCIFLGVLTEISMIAWDLTMILGTAHGLNLIFGVDLFTCVFLTAIDAVLFPVFATLLDNGKAKFLGIFIASFLLLFYVLGVLFSQPEISISTSGTLMKLNGESAFALMSLLGANIMPHNFYLHSSIVQQDLGPLNVSKGLLCNDHFFAILCIFSGIVLVNYALMNAAANVFYNAGLVILTFQDALSLIDQACRSSIVPFAFLLVLFISRHIVAVTGNLGRQAILQDFFGMDIPGWLHHVTIRVIAIIPALHCVWNSGAEGVYQLLILSQVVVALMLPSSVIPLFRIASSRSVMGVNKVSQFVEFLALITFVGMLGLKIAFVVEMVFGNSDWVGNLRWNVGSSISTSYIFLLTTASALLLLMLWLATTPLKSATSRLDAQAWNWDVNDPVFDSSAQRERIDLSETGYYREESVGNKEPALAPGKSLGTQANMSVTSSDLNLPKTPVDYDIIPNLTAIADNGSNIACPTWSESHPEESSATVEAVGVSTHCDEGSVSELVDTISREAESFHLAEKTTKAEVDSGTVIDDQGDICEPEASSKGVSGMNSSLQSDGPGSYRSPSFKGEEGGSGTGSLSRLGGLGRAARRQLATVLEEFWGQLFDFHGQPTQEAMAKKLDLVLGVISKSDQKPANQLKVDPNANEFTGCFTSVGGTRSDSPINSGVYNTAEHLGMQSGIEPLYRGQRGSSSPLSSRLQMLDAYMQHSGPNALDAGERRYSSYSSLRLPPSSDGTDYQPATVHGYQIASYLNRIPKERQNDYLDGKMETLTPKSSSLGISSYIDPPGFTSARKLQNGLSTMKPPGFSTTKVSRNISAQSGRPVNDRWSPGPTENVNNAVNTKKFHSLPDISGLSHPYMDSHLSDRTALSDSTTGYGIGTSLHPSSLSKVGPPLAYESLSPSKPYRDPFTLQYSSRSEIGSLWTRQPFEQFGLSDKTHKITSEGVGIKRSLGTEETTSVADSEEKLLQSFRHCIIKLLKLEGSDWLFTQNDGADEDLIDRVAAREKFHYEAETREISRLVQMGEAQYSFERKPGSALKNVERDYSHNLVSSFPNCGDGCVWRVDLIVSFGVWCIHRVLELSLMESRPELWGKYTYVLNRLQGIIDLAFSKPRSPMTPCFCLQIPAGYQQQRSSPPPFSNGGLPPPAKQGKGKITTATMLVEIIKDVEIAISYRKGRSGTAAGDVAFLKGKENMASVLKRYKRCLSSKNLLADTWKIVEKNKTRVRKDGLSKIVTDDLLLLGHYASICKSLWERSPSIPAGNPLLLSPGRMSLAFSELTREDSDGFSDFVDSDPDDFDDFDNGAGMLPNSKDEFVDGLLPNCEYEWITVSATDHRDPHDAALLPLVNMDTDIHMASPQLIALPDGGEIVQLESSEQKSLVDFDATNNRAYQSGILVSSEKKSTIEAYEGRWESVIQRTKKDMGDGLNEECLTRSALGLDDSTEQNSVDPRQGRGRLHSMEHEQPVTFAELGTDPANEGMALSSSELAATNNRAHYVRQDQNGYTTSHYEWKSTRVTSDRQGIAMSICNIKNLHQHFGCKHKDVVERLGVNVPMFKRTCRQHQIYCRPRWLKNNVWRSPDPRREKNLSPTFKTLSTNCPITMENDMGCQNLEPNELLPDSFEDLNFRNGENGSLAEIEKTPTFHDSFSGNCCEADICLSEYYKTQAAGGSFKWAFQLKCLTTQFTANPNLNTLVFPHPQIASTEVLSKNMGSSEDGTKLLASQAGGFLEGDVSECSNLTFPLEGQSMQATACPNHNTLQLPQPLIALTQILNENMGSSEVWIASQQEPFLEGHVYGSINLTVPTSSGPSLSQQPMPTTPYTMHRVLHMLPPLTSSLDASSVKMKATYRDTIIEFQLPLASGSIELKEEVAKILKLEIDSFNVRYKDEEGEGDWILIPCDKDLRNYLQLFSLLVNPVIRLLVVDKDANLTNLDPMALKQPATFVESGIDPGSNGIVSDLLRFVSEKEICKKAGKSWTRFYLLYEPPGADRSSLITDMANYLEFDICYLDLRSMSSIAELKNMLLSTPNRSLIAIQDIDHCAVMLPNLKNELTVSCLLKSVDGLFSRCGDERIIVFTTNHRDRYHAALVPLVNMDIYIPASSPRPIALPDGGEIVQLELSEQKTLVDFDATNNRECHSGILVSSSKNNNKREASKRLCMTESVLSVVDPTTGISLTEFDATNNGAHLVRACQGGSIMSNSEKKDTGEGLKGHFLTKSVLSLDDSAKQKSLPDCDATENEAHLFIAYQSCPVVNRNRGEALKRECITKSILGLEDLQQHSGGRRDNAAKSFAAIYDPGIHTTNSLAWKSFEVVETLRSSEQPSNAIGTEREREIWTHMCLEQSDARGAHSIHVNTYARRFWAHLFLSLCYSVCVRSIFWEQDDFVPSLSLRRLTLKGCVRKQKSPYLPRLLQIIAVEPGPTKSPRFSGGLFAKKWATRKGHSLGEKRPYEVSSLSMDLARSLKLDCSGGLGAQSAVSLPDGGYVLFVSEKKVMGKTLKRKCKTMSLFSLEDDQQHGVRRWGDAVKSLGRKRICRQPVVQHVPRAKHIHRRHVFHRWPFQQSAVGLPDGGYVLSVGKTLKRKCKTMSLFSLKDDQQHGVKRWGDAAKSLGRKRICRQLVVQHVSIAKRIHRQHVFHRWPFQQVTHLYFHFYQNWETMKVYSVRDKRPAEILSLSTDGKLVSRLQLVHILWLVKFLPRPSAYRGGGAIVGPIALLSSQFAATNRAHGIRNDQSGSSSASHFEEEIPGEPVDVEGTGSGISLEELQQLFGMKREDAAKILKVSVSTFKRICRQHGIKPWPYQARKKAVKKPPDRHRGMNTTGSSDDRRNLSASQEEPLLRGHVSGPIYGTIPTCTDPAPGQPTPIVPHPTGNLLASEEEVLLRGHVSGPIYGRISSCTDPAPSQTTPIVPHPAGNLEDQRNLLALPEELLLSQRTPSIPPAMDGFAYWGDVSALFDDSFPEGHASGSLDCTAPACSNPAPSQTMPTNATEMQNMDFVELKATYDDATFGNTTIKFQLPPKFETSELEEKVSKILKCELDSFRVEYKDKDEEWILMGCDENVREYLQLLNSLGNQVTKLKITKVPNTNLCETCGSSLTRKRRRHV